MVSKLRHNLACALPSSPLFHHVMAKKVLAMQLAADAKSSTSYGQSYGLNSKSFRLDGLLLFRTSVVHALCSNVRWIRVRLRRWRARGTAGRACWQKHLVPSYGRKSKLFWLDGLLLFSITMGLRCARWELYYYWNLQQILHGKWFTKYVHYSK